MSETTMLTPRLTICGIAELGAHAGAGVTHVLSILDPGWSQPAAFAAFDPHHRLELRFHDVIEPMIGMVPPEPEDIDQLLAFAGDLAATPDGHLLIHCHAGVSRSTATATLVLAEANPDRDAEAILAAVVALRPQAWPNLRMIELGDDRLDRKGTLVAAAAAVYRSALAHDPERAQVMIVNGRGREVEAAKVAPQRS